jgi:hypothetical protein
MSARLRALGISQRDIPAAKQYERLFERLGFSRSQIDQALVFGSSLKGSPEDMVNQFEHFVQAKLGMSSQEAALASDVSLGLIDLANQGGGIESLPPIEERHFGADDARRLEEIRTLRRNDPDKYEADKTLQLEELDLLEGVGSGQASHQADAPRPQGNDRLAQIREMRRNDPHSFDRNPALEAEELSLIEAQIASRPAEPSTPSPQPAAPAESAAASE